MSQCLLLLCEYLLAMLVPNISVAFSVLGSTVAVLIGACNSRESPAFHSEASHNPTPGFILPALVGMYGTRHKGYGVALLVVGIVFGASSFSATVYGLVVSQSAAPGTMLIHI